MDDLETVLDLISDADPAGRVLIPADFLVTDDDLQSLLQQGGEVGEGWDSGAGAPPSLPSSSPDRRRPWRRRLGLALGAAAVAAVVVLVIGISAGPGKPQSAAAALQDVAEVARAQPALAPGQVMYIRSEDSYVTIVALPPPPGATDKGEVFDFVEDGYYYAYQEDSTREVWKSDDAGRLVSTTGESRFLDERNRQAWIDAGRPGQEPGSTDVGRVTVDALGPTKPEDLAASSEPGKLYDEIGKQSGMYFGAPVDPNRDPYGEMFDEVISRLTESVDSPAQRAALFEVASRIEGIKLEEGAVDSWGRTGTGISYESDLSHSIRRLIFDPETAQMLESTEVATEGNPFADPGDVIGRANFDAPVLVDKVGDRPAP